MMKKYKKWVIGSVFFVCLMGVLLGVTCIKSNQAMSSFCLPLKFEGEYSKDEREWETLSEDTKFNALEGDLYLRGNFGYELSDALFHLYLDHIFFSLSINGEEVYYTEKFLIDGTRNTCATEWITFKIEAITPEDEVEIHLINPHKMGNPRAYQDFLENIYLGDNITFENFILRPSQFISRCLGIKELNIVNKFLVSGQLWRGIASAILVLSLLLLGVALEDTMGNKMFGMQLWVRGVTALFASGIMLFDTSDVSLWSWMVVFNTYGAQICRMFLSLSLCLCVAIILKEGWRKKIVSGIVVLGAGMDAIIAILCMQGSINICDTMNVWGIFQVVFCLVMIVLCVIELRECEKKIKLSFFAVIILILAMMLELCNGWFGWWIRGMEFKTIFSFIFLIYLVWTIKSVSEAYHGKKKAEQQEKEMIQNRIAITLSQIQPHFLYNSLNTIRYLCKENPSTAQKAIDDFSSYLRGNLDALECAKPVEFEKELEHVKVYLELEKMRFEDELNVVYDIQTTNFTIPAMTIQPLVENAVKHGLGKKENGGTVFITTKEEEQYFEVEIRDDGVGYDQNVEKNDGCTHIGIQNVRMRLLGMCNGTLRIESELNVGTTAIIRIPKE